MTCRCGAEFCWICTGYWQDHYSSGGGFRCPKELKPIQKRVLTKDRKTCRRLYEQAIYHRYQRAFQNHVKRNENVKRLIGTVSLDRESDFDISLIKAQVNKRETLLQCSYEMVKYTNYLHRICEFIAVASDGYDNNKKILKHSLYTLETILCHIHQILEVGRGYQAVEQFKSLCKTSERLIEHLRRAVIWRQLSPDDQMEHMTS